MAVDPLHRVRLTGVARWRGWLFRRRRTVGIGVIALLLAIAALGVWTGVPPLALSAAQLATLAAALLVVAPASSRGLSMAPTLGPATWGLLLGAPPWSVRRGDVVLFAVDGVRPMVKRVAGLAGDVLTFRDGGVWLGDLALPVPLDLSQLEPGGVRHVRVPEGCVFVVGDHVSSLDSRHFGAVPKPNLLGRYVALFERGTVERRLPSRAQAEDLEAIRAAKPPILPRLLRMLEVGGWATGHLELALRRGLLEAGLRDRLSAQLERAWAAAETTEDRALWARLGAEHHFEEEPERALAFVSRHLALGLDEPGALVFHWEANLLARLGRYEEALAAADRVTAAAGQPVLAAVRLSALLGLRRLDEVRAELAATDTANAWAVPSHAPYYRGLLAAVARDHETAERALLEALEQGFAEPKLLATTPHLASFRGTPGWARVAERAGLVEG